MPSSSRCDNREIRADRTGFLRGTTMSEEFQMSSLQDLAPPIPALSSVPEVAVAPHPPRTWYFLGSTIIALIAYAVKSAVMIASFVVLFFARGIALDTPRSHLLMLMKQGGWVDLAAIAAVPFTIATLWV